MSSIAGGNLVTNQSQVLWKLIGANMNTVNDQAFTKAQVFSSYLITSIYAVNASTSLSLAAGGVYDTAAKGGTPLVAAAQVYSGLTGSTLGLNLTLAAYGIGLRAGASLFLALTVAQGGAATADLYVLGVPIS